MPRKKAKAGVKTKKVLTPTNQKIRGIRSSLRKYGIQIATEIIREMLKEPIVCPYCREEIPVSAVSVDHIQPRSLGGADVPENIHLTCLRCNRVKGNMTDEQFRKFMDFMIENPEIYRNIRSRIIAGGGVFYARFAKKK